MLQGGQLSYFTSWCTLINFVENASRQASGYVLVVGPQWFGPVSVL